jgi:hypothetical protein
VTLRYSPCGERSNAATVAVTKREVSLLMFLLVVILIMSLHLTSDMTSKGVNLGSGQSFQVSPFLISLPIKVAQHQNVLLHVM